MERRYQVFISSTYLDLKDERRAVQEAILELDCFPAGMELFPASNEDAWTLIKGVIETSDYYLLVVGGKYGSIDEETSLSYTEKEFDFAVSIDKPVMAFLHGDTGSIPASKTELDPDSREKLEAFRDKVQSTKHIKYWATADDLAGKVSRSFTQMRKQFPAVGWVRGDIETSADALKENIELRKQIDRLQSQLATAQEVTSAVAEGLSGGDDKVTIEARYSIKAYTDSEDWTKRSVELTGQLPLNVTWNEILGEIGPLMIDEARQTTIKRRLEEWATERLGDEAKASAKAWVVESPDHGLPAQEPFSGKPTFDLVPKDFDSVIIQLKALGLITKGTRKRGVNDVGPWWILTKAGEDQLTALRAVRRPVAD